MQTIISPNYARTITTNEQMILTINITRYITASEAFGSRFFFDRVFEQEESDTLIRAIRGCIIEAEKECGYTSNTSVDFFGDYNNMGQQKDRIKCMTLISKDFKIDHMIGSGEISLKENKLKKGVLIPKKVKIIYGFYTNSKLDYLIKMYTAISSFDPRKVGSP